MTTTQEGLVILCLVKAYPSGAYKLHTRLARPEKVEELVAEAGWSTTIALARIKAASRLWNQYQIKLSQIFAIE